MNNLPTETMDSGEELDIVAPHPVQSIVRVSADTAAKWLATTVRNRALSAPAVERYRRDMAGGRWVYAADPIRFSTEGNLLDGQHRLTALSKIPGAELPMLVVRGLPADSQFHMDQGRKRSTGQQFALKGVPNAMNVTSGIRFYLVWTEGLMFKDTAASGVITTSQIEEWYNAHVDEVEYVTGFLTAIRSTDAPPSVGFAAALKFATIESSLTVDFFHDLANGGRPLGHPINTLDKRLQRIRREGLKMSNRDYLSLYILAWNATREGRQMTKFQRPNGGAWSVENFPVPK